MANALYDKGRNRFLTGSIDWVNHDVRCSLVDAADYAANLNTHEFYSSVVAVAAAQVATATLGSKTAVDGVADAADLTFTSVTGDQSEALVLYRWVTANGDSPLIAYIDTATGLPVTPNGGDIVVRWSDGVNKIFKL